MKVEGAITLTLHTKVQFQRLTRLAREGDFHALLQAAL